VAGGRIAEAAYQWASSCGVEAMDAFNREAAAAVGADELVTIEWSQLATTSVFSWIERSLARRLRALLTIAPRRLW